MPRAWLCLLFLFCVQWWQTQGSGMQSLTSLHFLKTVLLDFGTLLLDLFEFDNNCHSQRCHSAAQMGLNFEEEKEVKSCETVS